MHIPAPSRRKLDPKAQQGIFVGYSDESKAFRIWISAKSQIVISQDVTFDEDRIVKYTLPDSKSNTSNSSLIPNLITTVSNPTVPTTPTVVPPSPLSPHVVNLSSTQSQSPS